MWITDVIRRVVFENDLVCCLCFSTANENAVSVYDKVFLDSDHPPLDFTKIISAVFGNKISEQEYLSNAVCENCCNSVLSAYKFIKNSLEINETIKNSISNLTNNLETIDTGNLGTAKSIFVTVNPQNLENLVFLDSRKTVNSTSLLIKRFRSFIGTTSTTYNREKAKAYFDKLDREICKLCGTSCKNKYNLKRHMMKNCKYTRNVNCDDDDDNVDDLFRSFVGIKSATHKREKTKAYFNKSDRVICEQCGKSCSNKYNLKKHMMKNCINTRNANGDDDDNNVDDLFQSFIGIKPAISKREKTKAYFDKLDRVTCTLCGKSCKNKYNLKRHMMENCKNTRNIKCDDDDNNVDDLFKNEKISKKPRQSGKYICGHCEQRFRRKSNLLIHIHNQCKNVPRETKVPVCRQCGEIVDKNCIKIHAMSHSVDYVCLKCGRIFKTQKAHKRHLLIPNCNEKPEEFNPRTKEYSCHICGSQFTLKESLSYHIRARHVGDGFACTICDKKLSTPYGLKLHMVVHTKEKNYMCTTCGGKFVSKHSLLYHTRTHTGEKPYKCKFCDERFLSASRRSLHIRTHHLPPQLQCKYCSKKFKLWGMLSRHRRRHFNPQSSLYLPELKCEA